MMKIHTHIKYAPSNNLLIMPASMIWVYHQHAMPPQISSCHIYNMYNIFRCSFSTPHQLSHWLCTQKQSLQNLESHLQRQFQPVPILAFEEPQGWLPPSMLRTRTSVLNLDILGNYLIPRCRPLFSTINLLSCIPRLPHQLSHWIMQANNTVSQR